jgi:hypothetical protein
LLAAVATKLRILTAARTWLFIGSLAPARRASVNGAFILTSQTRPA